MISFEMAIHIHKKLILNFGGGDGLRDADALDAALNRPFATFDGKDLYSDPIDKAAALFESLIINHPFIDGNKRTAYLLMKYLLFQNGLILKATNAEKYQFVIEASTGHVRLEEIRAWLKSKAVAKM